MLRHGKYDYKIDVWAATIIIYVNLVGYMPFGGKNPREILNLIEKSNLKYRLKISPESKDLSEFAHELILVGLR